MTGGAGGKESACQCKTTKRCRFDPWVRKIPWRLSLLFSHSVMFDSLWPHGVQHIWLPCPSQSPGACSNVHWVGDAIPTILSSVILFSSCLQFFTASGSFLISWLIASCGQSNGASASASVLPMNIQSWVSFRIDWFDLLAGQGTLRSLLQYHSSKSWQLTLVFLPRKSHG